MGFREYNPGLNRILSRDYYNGAFKDMALCTDPWNTSRYMFAGGNPITGIELDGHYAIDDEGRVPASEPPIARPPTVSDAKLRENIGHLYARPGVTDVYKDGKTTTALIRELATGEKTGPDADRATYHYESAVNAAKGIAKRLSEHENALRNGRAPLLSEADEGIARAHLKEVWDVLNRTDVTHAVENDLKARGVHAAVETKFREIAANPAVREQTGAQFDAAPHPKNPEKVYRGCGGHFFGRTLGVVGVFGDLQYVWVAGRIMSGKPPNPGMYPGDMLCTITGCPTVS
jgi:hypothetical protein